jgi:hypothetical protein
MKFPKGFNVHIQWRRWNLLKINIFLIFSLKWFTSFINKSQFHKDSSINDNNFRVYFFSSSWHWRLTRLKTMSSLFDVCFLREEIPVWCEWKVLHFTSFYYNVFFLKNKLTINKLNLWYRWLLDETSCALLLRVWQRDLNASAFNIKRKKIAFKMKFRLYLKLVNLRILCCASLFFLSQWPQFQQYNTTLIHWW